MKSLPIFLTAALALSSVTGFSAESSEEHNARMAWWRDAKFGMFIHWGVYAVPAGTYKGEQVPGIGEWIMLHAKIPVQEYRAFARDFNPVKYDPQSWARLAKEAGMKYIVITSKHHDGFALFPSDVTDWDVADATPYKKDLITPLARAARAEGLKFGTYYSQAQDWTNPGGAKSRYKEGDGWDDAHKGDFDEYLAKIAVPQVREILTRIKPDILWWDTPHWMTEQRAKPLHDLLALRPGIITNNRLGGGFKGDTETPEQHIPATGFKDRDWETCMTMNGTWGYKSYDHNWKPATILIRNLVDIVSKGGNYLLNVGPTAQGEIPEESIERLKEIGAWMKTNGEAIYGTTASPFKKLTWGRCTKKVTDQGGTLYLHVFDWPEDGRLVAPGLKSQVAGARLLATGEKINAKLSEEGTIFAVPAKAPDAVASVIEVKFTGPLQLERVLPGPQANGVIVLGADYADIHNTLRAHAKLQGGGEKATVTEWNNAETQVSWDFRCAKAGKYKVRADVSGTGGGKLSVELGKASMVAEVLNAPTASRRSVEIGTVEVPAGEQTLELKPVKQGWKGFDLHRIELEPL